MSLQDQALGQVCQTKKDADEVMKLLISKRLKSDEVGDNEEIKLRLRDCGRGRS